MDRDIPRCMPYAVASSLTFESNNLAISDSEENSDETVLKLVSQAQSYNCKRQGHLFWPGSVPSDASFPKEIQRKRVTFHEAHSRPTCVDDDCGLVLGLGCITTAPLPKTSSTPALFSFGTSSDVNFETLQASVTLNGTPTTGQGMSDGATSGISNHEFHKDHNRTQSYQNSCTNIVSCSFTQPEVSENKLEIESNKYAGTTYTKSLDMDPDILQLGLSSGPRKSLAMSPLLVVSQSDNDFMPVQSEETPTNEVESPISMHIPVDEGSTSAQNQSRGYIPSLIMAPRLDKSGQDWQPSAGTAGFMAKHPLQETQETRKTSCSAMIVNVISATAEQQSNSKTCRFTGCQKGARGSSGLCISHGGGHRCQKPGCTKGAESRTVYCKAHGGGRRCQELGCTKSAEGRTDYCIGHGGGRRCIYEGCSKAARGRSGLCIRHGGGKRCQKEGCTRSAEGQSGLCISHGGGRRCQYPECTKGAQGSTMYCKAHGGGRRCTHPGCSKGAEGSTSLCKGHGGGKRCMFNGGGICPKSVHGGTQFCVAHGGGKRCVVQACTKSARGRTDYCVKHGGGKRCKFGGCEKSAQGSTDFCKAHGGGKRCLWGQEGSVYAREVLHGKNGEIIQGPCDKFARGKIGLCAAHTALVQDHRSHGGKAVGHGIGPGLFYGLACQSVSNSENISFGATACSDDTSSQLDRTSFERDYFAEEADASRCVESDCLKVCYMDQNINRYVNNIDMDLRAKETDGQKKSKETNNFARIKMVKVSTSVDYMNIDTEQVVGISEPCVYQSASVHSNPYLKKCLGRNLTHGHSEVGGYPYRKEDTLTGFPLDQAKNYCQALESDTFQPLITHKVLAPLPLKKDLKNMQIDKYRYGSGSNEVGTLSLPEGRVHGGSLMAMLSKDLGSGHEGFVPFLASAFDSGKKSQGKQHSGVSRCPS